MITSCKFPSKSGEIADIVLGFDSIEGKQVSWQQKKAFNVWVYCASTK